MSIGIDGLRGLATYWYVRGKIIGFFFLFNVNRLRRIGGSLVRRWDCLAWFFRAFICKDVNNLNGRVDMNFTVKCNPDSHVYAAYNCSCGEVFCYACCGRTFIADEMNFMACPNCDADCYYEQVFGDDDMFTIQECENMIDKAVERTYKTLERIKREKACYGMSFDSNKHEKAVGRVILRKKRSIVTINEEV